MSTEMVFREIYQFLGRWLDVVWEDLREDMATDLLDPYFIIASFRSPYDRSDANHGFQRTVYILARDLGSSKSPASDAPGSVAYDRHRVEALAVS